MIRVNRRKFVTLLMCLASATTLRFSQARDQAQTPSPAPRGTTVINAWLLIAGNELSK